MIADEPRGGVAIKKPRRGRNAGETWTATWRAPDVMSRYWGASEFGLTLMSLPSLSGTFTPCGGLIQRSPACVGNKNRRR